MKVLITGEGGQLAWELQRTSPSDSSVAAFGVDVLDVRKPDEIRRKVLQVQPDLLINAAAYTAVDRAELEPALAYAVNAEGAGNLARICAERGVRLVHVSTDFVFNGRASRPYSPEATPNPVGFYGASKLDGERQVVDACGDTAVILRTAWVYSVHGKNFVKTMLRLMGERDALNVVADQVGTPTWARGLAEAIWSIAARPSVRGIHHWTDAGVASWYDFAVAIMEEACAIGVLDHPVWILPISTEQYPTSAQRPSFSVLDKTDTWAVLETSPRHWRDALRRMLEEFKCHN